MEHLIKNIAHSLRTIKEHEEKVKSLKEELNEKLNGENLTHELLDVTYRKPYEKVTLKKAKQELLKMTNPEFFDTKEVKGGYTYKVK